MPNRRTEIRRLVEAAGGVFVRHGKGTHQIYRINNRMVVVSLSRSDYRSDNQPCVAIDG